MKQLDIYGNEIPLEETETKPLDHQGGRIALKSWFRNCYGFRQGLYCKNCKFFKIQMRKGQVYHKCIKNSLGKFLRSFYLFDIKHSYSVFGEDFFKICILKIERKEGFHFVNGRPHRIVGTKKDSVG